MQAQPSPNTVEFLSRIRGMIDTAKDKMTSRRFIPNLIDIPEEQHGAYGYGYGYGTASNGRKTINS